jgi:hypothetical protein
MARQRKIIARSAAEARGIRKALRAAGAKFEFRRKRNPRRRTATPEKRFEKFSARMRRKYGPNWRASGSLTAAEKRLKVKLIRLIHG